MPRLLRILTLLLALALLAASPALGSGVDVIRDCTANGRIAHAHSPRDLRNALTNLPADIDEYSNCRQQIRQALLATSKGGGGGGAGGLGGGPEQPPPNRAERGAIVKAKTVGGKLPVRIGKTPVTPGAAPFSASGSTHSLPTPLVAVLLMLVLPAALGASLAARRLVLSRRQG